MRKCNFAEAVKKRVNSLMVGIRLPRLQSRQTDAVIYINKNPIQVEDARV